MILFFKKNKLNLFAFLAILLLVFTFFYPTLLLGFFSDDYHFLYVTSQQDSVWKYLFSNIIGESSGGSYGPMLNFIFTAQYKLFYLHYFFYHLITLLVYALTAFVLFLFTKNISKNNLVAWGSALLFIFLQNHTSTVAWVAVLPHLWATLFFVLFLYFYHRFIIEKKGLYYILALLTIAFSLFTKEIAIAFPIVFILLELFFVDNKNILSSIWRICKRGLALVIVLFSYLLIRLAILGYVFGYYGSNDLGTQLAPKVKTLVDIVVSMFVVAPIRQNISGIALFHPVILLIFFFFGLAIIAYVSKKYQTRVLWFSFLSFLAMSIPFLSVHFERVGDEGERYGYLLSIFFVIFLAQFVYLIFSKLKNKKVFYFSFIVLFVILSFVQYSHKIQLWQKSADLRENILTQFANNLDKSKENYFIFLAMPDNFAGTQLTRNAVLEMFKLENNFYKMSGERVTMYSLPTQDNFQQKIIEFKQDLEGNLFLQKKDGVGPNVFRGSTHYSSQFGDFTREDDTIKIVLNQDYLEDFVSEEHAVQLVYFDGEKLNFVSLNK